MELPIRITLGNQTIAVTTVYDEGVTLDRLLLSELDVTNVQTYQKGSDPNDIPNQLVDIQFLTVESVDVVLRALNLIRDELRGQI